ncbi:MAG: rhodanese-like domain-containing protein [Alphaproteobacteria bacterium]
MNTISRNELRDLMEKKERFYLVEALPETFYETGHLPGAISIPAGYVVELASNFIPDKKSLVIVYCNGRICQNSRQAIEEFQSIGYSNLRHYEEGKEDWRAAGWPLEKQLAEDYV